MHSKRFSYFKNNFFIYTLVSLMLSVVVYIVVGQKLSVEYLVSISLVITGGLWSYLSIELTKVKELRGEYVKRLEGLESSVLDFLSQVPVLFSALAGIKLYSGDVLVKKNIEIERERNKLAVLQNGFKYKAINIQDNRFNKVDLKELDGAIKEMSDRLDDYFKLHVNNRLNLSYLDEKEVSAMNVVIMTKLSDIFSGIYIDFEDFSESYYNKKCLCYSVVVVCIFTVILKCVLQ